jgi:hypothetical protein
MLSRENPLKLNIGLGRFEEKGTFATEGVVTYVESSANGTRKSPIIRRNPEDFNLFAE